MASHVKFNQAITVGGQPAMEELRQLKDQGFRSVVNLRAAGEENQPLSPQEEGRRVEELGMDYANIPVTMDSMSEDKVEEFRRRLAALPQPVYVHCAGGKRAGAFTMMHVAVEQKMSGDQALQKARDMGFECDAPALEKFVKTYVDRRVQP